MMCICVCVVRQSKRVLFTYTTDSSQQQQQQQQQQALIKRREGGACVKSREGSHQKNICCEDLDPKSLLTKQPTLPELEFFLIRKKVERYRGGSLHPYTEAFLNISRPTQR